MYRLLKIAVFILFVAGLVTTAFATTNDEINQIAQRWVRGERVTHAEKILARDAYRALRLTQQPVLPPNPPTIMRTGGPDDYGYSFKDNTEAGGPAFNWIPHYWGAGDATHAGPDSIISGWTDTDDGYAGPIGVQFAYQLYGVSTTQLYLGSNGYVTDSPYSVPVSGGIPQSLSPAGIYFWGDDMQVDFFTTVTISRMTSPTRFVITYDSLTGWDGPDRLSCQIVLTTNNNILVSYRNISGVGFGVTFGIQNNTAVDYLSYGTPTPTNNTAILYSIPCANPTLNSPANSATGITGTSTTLTWTPGPCSINYDVFISTDSSLVRSLATSVRNVSHLNATSRSVPITNGQVYYWIVAGRDVDSNVVPSLMFHFSTSAQLTGTRTIGGFLPDYATFAAALSALTANGVGPGGVTMSVRSGTYNEAVVVNNIPNTSSSNPVIFQKESGTVTINAPVSAGLDAGVKLHGCNYVTFNGINVSDNSAGSNFLDVGYWITGASASQGSQNNTIKNSTITLRVDFQTYGVYQSLAGIIPSSTAGSNSNNHYLNLRISKCREGLHLVGDASFPDLNTEIGSDVVGVNYANRFVIGALGTSDTIGGPGNGYGIYTQQMSGLIIHDIDVTNIYANEFPATGIECDYPYGPTTIYNNRFFNVTTTNNSNVIHPVYGIFYPHSNVATYSFKVYNNMFSALVAQAPFGIPSSVYNAIGIYADNNITIDNNSFLINQLSGSNLNYSSACIDLLSGADTLRNNIITNFTSNQSASCIHIGILNTSPTLFSNFNSFYIPNATNGYVGNTGGTNYATLTTWRTAPGARDANSTTGNPQYVSSVAPYDLHVQLGKASSVIEGRATPLAYIANDIDGETRATTAPDIGADEGNFLGHAIAFIHPVGGENYYISSQDTVSWVSNGVLGTVTIQIDRNYPTSWTTIGTPNYQSTPFTWTISAPATTTAKMRIYDTSSPLVGDTSFATFNVIAPVTNITRLNGGEVIYIGTTDSIMWTENYPGNVTIKYNSNYPAGGWTTLASGINAANGKYLFTVPNAASVNTRFAVISNSAPNGNDTSNANLTIRTRNMNLSHPNGGETLVIGVPDTFRWTNFGTYPRTVGISYAGAIPESVVVLSNSLPANSTTYNWTPAGRTGATCRIYLADTNGIVGWSNSNFTVALPALTVTYPNGGENLFRGENDTLRWTTSNLSGTVKVEVNRSFPSANWEILDSTTLATQQYWAWHPIAGATSGTCRIRVRSNSNGFANDTSNANFSISQRNMILNRPNGGEVFQVNRPDTIRFTAQFMTNGVRIELNRTFPSATWELLKDSVGTNDVLWVWNPVTTPLTNTARIRITGRGLNNPVYSDTSNLNFSIQPNTTLYQSTGTISFNGTRPHTTDSTLLVIKNFSNLPFHYLTLTGATGRFSKRVMDNDSLTNANDSLRIWVSFSPDTVNSFLDTLRMTFESPYNPITIPIVGLATGAYAQFSLASLTFPNTVEPTRRDSLTLRIFGKGNLALQNVRLVILPSSLPYSTAPTTIATINANDSATVKVYFAPASPGTYTGQLGVVSNAVNGDTIKLNLSGNSQYVTPATPGNLHITRSGNDAILTWNRVDTTVTGVPFTVTSYMLYTSTNGLQPYSLLATITGASNTTYTHTGAIIAAPNHTYYKVTAYFGSSSDSIIRRLRPGMSEMEVRRILSQDE